MEPQAYHELHQLEASHWWYRGMRAIMDALAQPILKQPHPLTILDAGCGVGGNISHWQSRGHVYGCDYARLALGYAQQQHAGKVIQATVEGLPYRDACFDMVMSYDVLYAREVRDDEAALREFARVTRPQGYLLLRLPALPALAGQHDGVVHGVRRYVREEVTQKLRQAGLEPLHLSYANSLLLPLVYLARRWQSLWGASLPGAPSDVRPAHAVLNQFLYTLLRCEAAWIERKRRLPIGVSIIALAQKVQA